MERILIVFLILMNVLGVLLFGLDKSFAKSKSMRIPENLLLTVGALGGGFGSFIGMRLFHHKTKKPRFRILIPLCCVCQIFIWWWVLK